jgi:hypothetical protein
VAVDNFGNVYFTDYGNDRIRRITSGGVISTVAGTGAPSFSGDGGPATLAALNGPSSLWIDPAGDLYFIDTANYRVREVLANGTITTVAGNGSYGSSGDGGPATSAQLTVGCCFIVGGLVVDSSNSIYIGGDDDLRKVTPDGIIHSVSTYINGYLVSSLALDSSGNVYVGMSYSIVKFTPALNFCSYTVASPPAQPAAGGNFSLQVNATTSSCGWTASSNAAWITVQTAAGSGTNAARFTVAGNNSSSSRSGTITVAGQTFTVIQAALTGAGASTATHFSVSAPASASAGVPVQVTVTALDASNHTVTNYTDPVSFASTDGSAYLPGNATLTSGVGAFSASFATTGSQTVTVADLFSPSIAGTTAGIAVSSPAGLRFIPVTPCRLFDTRHAGQGAPFIAGNTSRSFAIPGACGIPSTAQAYSVNVAVVPHAGLGFLTVWPTGQTQPTVATLNSVDGRVKSNAAIVPAGTGGAISVYATNDTDVILDINGYFVPASTSGALAFYPVTPCRLVDTRHGMLLSGPFAGGSSRTLPIRSSGCNVPPTAQAYSLNFTTVAPGQVGFLTAYPTGVTQPTVATLNALPPLPLTTTPVVIANAAIVRAGTNGSIDVFASNATDLVVDINGYFAPPGAGGLSLYNLPPCRVLDTRQPTGSLPFSGELDVNVLGAVCGGTPQAQGYVFNSTVVPPAALGFLTLWPQGTTQPAVATLNALDGAITNNMAIVPTTNTEVSAFGSNATHLILDIFGYFAP